VLLFRFFLPAALRMKQAAGLLLLPLMEFVIQPEEEPHNQTPRSQADEKPMDRFHVNPP
jgi:hypothetical protein